MGWMSVDGVAEAEDLVGVRVLERVGLVDGPFRDSFQRDFDGVVADELLDAAYDLGFASFDLGHSGGGEQDEDPFVERFDESSYSDDAKVWLRFIWPSQDMKQAHGVSH